MATCIFRGDAQDVAQVDRLTVGGTVPPGVGETFYVTINGKTETYTADGTESTVLLLATAIQAVLAASTVPEFQEVTWSLGTTNGTIDCTGVTAGQPFTITAGETAAATTFVKTSVTSPSGKNWWSVAANWSGGAVPANGDTVYVGNTDTDILYGLDQSAVLLAALHVLASYTGKIGLPQHGEYYEYRDTELYIQTAALTVGRGDGAGSGRIRIRLGTAGTTATAIVVDLTGAPVDDAQPALHIRDGYTGSTLLVQRGTVGVAVDPGTTATLATVKVGSAETQGADAVVQLGAGLTLATGVNMAGGDLAADCNVAALDIAGGTFRLRGAATMTTLAAEGGTVYYESTGTLTSGTLRNSAALDFTRDTRARTVTNLTLNAGTRLSDPVETVTFTNPFRVNCRLADLTLDIGSNFTVARAA